MRKQLGATLVASLLLTACFGEEEVKDDTGPTDTTPTSHPLVPDEYQNTWDWDASGCEAGKSAVYHLAEGYTVEETISGDPEMVMYFSERWFWFHGEEDFDGDCVDQFDYRGVATRYAWGSNDPCSVCEEEYWGSMQENTEVENGCNIGYDGIFMEDPGSTNSYDTVVMKFDTLTISGNPNEQMGVIQAVIGGGYIYPDVNYGRGEAIPDTEGDWGGPTTYHWVNTTTLCI